MPGETLSTGFITIQGVLFVFICFCVQGYVDYPNNIYCCVCGNMQAKMERDKKYSEESFWLKTVNLREMFQDDRFTNLYDVQTQVNKIYSLALENSMEQSTIQEW